jgi:hypothetical protein
MREFVGFAKSYSVVVTDEGAGHINGFGLAAIASDEHAGVGAAQGSFHEP